MMCHEIENRLPAYPDGFLSPKEKKSIAGHLASCPRCSRALADLKKAGELVHDLAEVEPPPFFEQRIMSRVRQEAGRKQGILRWLFHPLHIKVPLQALATLLFAVLAFHVYQQGDPELKQMAPIPLPLTEQKMSQATAESSKTPAALLARGSVQATVQPPEVPASPFVQGKVQGTAELSKPPAVPSATIPVKRAPAGELPEKSRQQFAVAPFEKGGKGERLADSRAPVREGAPAAAKPAETSMAPQEGLRDKDTPPVRAEALGKAKDGGEKRDTDRALATLPPAPKRQEKMADTGAAAGASRKALSGPSPSRMTAAAAIERSVMDVTVHVGNADAAVREIEARLGQVNARIVEKQRREGSEFLKIELAAQNAAAFLDLLKAIGRVDREAGSRVVPEGNVLISIKIVGYP